MKENDMSPAPSDASWQPPYPESAPAPPASVSQARPVRDPIHQKIPFLAAILSAFPGMWNIYNGLYLRGLVQFLIVASLMNMMNQHGNPFLGMSLVFFWAFSIL